MSIFRPASFAHMLIPIMSPELAVPLIHSFCVMWSGQNCLAVVGSRRSTRCVPTRPRWWSIAVTGLTSPVRVSIMSSC